MRLSGTLLILALAPFARADDAAAPASDSISAAKKDLAAIKSPLGQPDAASVLPAMDMKDLGPMPGTTRLEVPSLLSSEKDPTLDPAKRKTGTGNWLVDAMDKNTSSQASRTKEKDEILKGDPDLIRADEKGIRLEKDPLAIEDTREKERPKEPVESVYNPLDAFMSGWVSARDHDLLLTSSKADGLSGADLGKVHADALPGMDIAQGGPVSEALLQPVDTASFADAKGSNPYLALLDLPAPQPVKGFTGADLAGFAPVELPELSHGLSTSGVDARPIDAPRSFIPDFVQPDDDDKYFKQMKKF